MKNVKQLFGTLLTLLSLYSINAQSDTLLFEDFNGEEFPVGWLSLDEDGIAPADPQGSGVPGDWFMGNFANGGADSAESVCLSISWLVGFAEGNRNWLILPPTEITGTDAILKWESAPAVGPSYLDGYTILVSTTEALDPSTADTLMHFAQNINDNENDFSAGTLHTAFGTNALPGTSPVQYPGLLTEYSASLGAYVGETVYIAFLHDSDDDNYIALDDVAILETTDESASIGNLSNDYQTLKLFPNPTNGMVNIELESNPNEEIQVQISDVSGRILELRNHFTSSANEKIQLDLTSYANGLYNVQVISNNGIYSAMTIKK